MEALEEEFVKEDKLERNFSLIEGLMNKLRGFKNLNIGLK
jgi:hypothetical protein